MKKSLIWLVFLCGIVFAQEDDSYDYEEEEEEEETASPAASLSQALKGSGLSGRCVEDFADILGERGFSMTNFMKELPPEVAKVKLKMKSPFPFGKPKDNDVTSVGLSVRCIKSLPESPAELQSLLKNISLKAGLNPYSIPSNVGNEGGGGTLKTVMSAGLIAGGVGAIIYGLVQNGEVKDSVDKRDGKAAVDAEGSRNTSYGVGAALLAGGLGVVIFF